MSKKRKTERKNVQENGTKVTKEGLGTKVQEHYKDTVFRMLFRDKENLLSLYNAVNGTAHTEVEELEITTLENAIYMNYKNDVSFVLGLELMIYEHQSTVNPNMPLRNLFYVSKLLQGLTKEKNLYGSGRIMVPAPRFAVFYNGTALQPARHTLRLSDSFQKEQEEPELELKVAVYNINLGNNQELMKDCRVLGEYAQYVYQVRKFAEEMPFEEAVEKAVDYCIKNGILAEFLSKNRAEAIAVSIFEYDEEKHIQSERETVREEGIKALIETSKELGAAKQTTKENLMKKMQLTEEKAEESMKKYWQEGQLLSKNRAEAIAVSIFEYDEEKHIQSERETAKEEGVKEGIEKGKEEGLKQGLIETSRELGATRQATKENLMKKMQLTEEKAEEYMKKYWI